MTETASHTKIPIVPGVNELGLAVDADMGLHAEYH